MDTKEILQVVDVVSNEKGVSKEVIFEAIEAALAAATRKVGGEHMDVRVAIDRHSGSYETFRRWTVVDDEADEFDPEQQFTLSGAQRDHPGVAVGDVIEEPLPAVPFGRIASQMAKQVIVQKVRDAEREKIVETYTPRIGHMLVGQVKRLDRGNLIVDLGGNVDALLTRDDMIARENIRIGDRVCALLADARIEQRGPQLFLTRRAPKLMMELFRREVPEVADGIVEVVGCARDPGVRAKIAVRSYDPRIDPIGACVGMHGTRVQAVSNELAGERVDIVLFDVNPAQFVLNALSPAKVVSITMDEESHTMDVAVAEDQLSIAIGRGGQNVRLASELTGWELNLMTEEQASREAGGRDRHPASDVRGQAGSGPERGRHPGPGRLHQRRGSGLRAGRRAAGDRGIRRRPGAGAAQPRPERAADAGNLARGSNSATSSRRPICWKSRACPGVWRIGLPPTASSPVRTWPTRRSRICSTSTASTRHSPDSSSWLRGRRGSPTALRPERFRSSGSTVHRTVRRVHPGAGRPPAAPVAGGRRRRPRGR